MGTVLTIEDTQDSFDLIADALENSHRVLHARTGHEGLARARRDNPDVVLLDMNLPGVSGWEVARRLKLDPALAGIPVVALTAHAMRGDREKCLAAGCDDYMAKPICVRDLMELIERHLNAGKTAVPGSA